MTFTRKMAHMAQNRWLNGPGGHAEALEAVDAQVALLVQACAAAVIDGCPTAKATGRACAACVLASKRILELAGQP